MIPKIIHYCWFGGKPLPSLAVRCIESWKRFLPEFEIKRWDESNFDWEKIPFTRKAYSLGKYAFVSDYLRFKALYEEGGVYFDTDVELIKTVAPILKKGSFVAREYDAFSPGPLIATGLGMGVKTGDRLCRYMLDFYEAADSKSFFKGDDTMTVVIPVSDFFYGKGLIKSDRPVEIEDYTVYPPNYFCPMNSMTREVTITPETVAIHHYAASWKSPLNRLKKRIKTLIGPRLTSIIIGK